MKFPRTRRDRLKNEIKRQKAEQQRHDKNDEVDGEKKEAVFSSSSPSHGAPSERTGYPSPYLPSGKRNAFDRDSAQPLGANVESWSNLVDSRATSHGTHLNHEHSRTYGEEELEDDDVFFNEDDMRRMRLGMSDPNSQYYMYPGAYATIAMLGGIPEESHFGQGLEYFGPGYQVGASGLEVFFCLWNILMYLLDIGSDIYLAYLYFTNEHYVWFGLTLGFVAIPALTMSIFSLVLYLRDYNIAGEKRSSCRWASRIIFIILQLAPLFRMFETLVYGCKSRDPDREIVKRRRFYDKMVNEDTDSMLLRLFESFMESAPQLVLQLYIITQIGTDKGVGLVVVQVFGLVTSLISLAGCLVSFQKSLRLSQPTKEKLRFPGMALMFMWRVFTIAARVMALAMFASYFKYWTFVVVGVHWLAMLIWMVRQDTRYCVKEKENGEVTCNKCQELCFRILCAFVHIFCFFNLLEGNSRLRCIVFYSIMYLENTILVMGWYVAASMKTSTGWYHLPTLLIVLVGFWFGILFQGLYYKIYHPNNASVLNSRRRIRWCIPCSELSLTKETHYLSKPTGSVMARSQLSLNQTAQSYHGTCLPHPDEIDSIEPAPTMHIPHMTNEPYRKTPVPTFPLDRNSSLTDRSSMSSSRPSSFSRHSGQPYPKIVQKKWQPPERVAAGQEKLNMSMESGSSSTTGPGSFRYKASTPQSRAEKHTRRADPRGQVGPPLDETNEEPLPMSGQNSTREVPSNYLPPHLPRPVNHRTPPLLKMASLPRDEPQPSEPAIWSHTDPLPNESLRESEEELYTESESDDGDDTVPLTNVDRRPLPILEQDELPVEDELPPGAAFIKVSAL